MLTRGFDQLELAFLNEQPRFRIAVARMRTVDDFDEVCELGQTLLDDRDFVPCQPTLHRTWLRRWD